MTDFRKFMIVWLSALIAGTVLTAGTLRMLYTEQIQTQQDNTLMESSGHFSVRWMGYVPTYSDQYPQYYICISNLATDQLTLPIALQIKNQENRSFYFTIEQYSTPPAGWTLSPYTIGLINKDETKTFAYTTLRTKPSSIPGGRLTETITLVVRAYYDSLYTEFYSEDNFPVTFNLLDKTAGVWTTLYIDNFDDGDTHQWTGGTSLAVTTQYYRSFQHSLMWRSDSGAYKNFDISGAFTEVYLIAAIKSYSWGSSGVYLNDIKCFEPDVPPTNGVWYQFVTPLPTSQITKVMIFPAGVYTQYAYMDDVYVIAK